MLTVRLLGNGLGLLGGQGFSRAHPRATECVVEVAMGRGRRAPAPRPERLATGLEAPICDGRPARAVGLAAIEADRGFSVGTFYLPGQMVDRRA